MKKRVISGLLVVIMVLGILSTTSGCSPVLTKNKVEKDPSEFVVKALNNTVQAMQTPDSASPMAFVQQVLHDGTITIEMPDAGMSALINSNEEKEQFALQLSGQGADGEKESIDLYANKNEVAIQAKPLFGVDSTYGFNLDTMTEDMKKSALWDTLGAMATTDDAAAQNLTEVLKAEVERLKAPEKLKELKTGLLAVMDKYCTSVEVGSTISGYAVTDSINVTYVINAEGYKEIIETLLVWVGDESLQTICDAIGTPQDPQNPITAANLVKQLTEALKDAPGFQTKLMVALTIDAERIITMSCATTIEQKAAAEDDEDEEEQKTAEEIAQEKENNTSLQITLDFGPNPQTAPRQEFRIAASNGLGEVESYVSFQIERIIGKNSYDKRYYMVTNEGGEESKMGMTFSLNQKKGDYSLNLNTGFFDVTMSGVYAVKDNAAQLTIASIASGNDVTETNINLTMKRGGGSFQMPAYINIFTATKSELQPLVDAGMFDMGTEDIVYDEFDHAG